MLLVMTKATFAAAGDLGSGMLLLLLLNGDEKQRGDKMRLNDIWKGGRLNIIGPLSNMKLCCEM